MITTEQFLKELDAYGKIIREKIESHVIPFCSHATCFSLQFTQCLFCKKPYCYEHKKSLIRYEHDVFDWAPCNLGWYCQSCDEKLRETKEDPVHQAYLTIQELRIEYIRFRALPKYLQTSDRLADLQQRKEQAEQLTTRNNRLGFHEGKINAPWVENEITIHDMK